jgi:glycine/D-amino acid oxidase-like deaminating enzyme
MAEAAQIPGEAGRDYRKVSFWLESAGDDLTPRPPLRGAAEVDVAILGAGFTGLWTAYYLLRRVPALRVAVVERHIAGFGASGRNGAWCSSGFPVSLDVLYRRYGAEQARAVFHAMVETVDEVGRVAAAEGIDAQFRKGGELLVARGNHQLRAIEQEFAVLRYLGLDAGRAVLSTAELGKRLNIARAVAALYTPACATIHPGKLVRGLARAVERLGGVIYEQSEVINFTGGTPPHLTTAEGILRAQSLVLAGEAYLTRLPQLHRIAIPVYSLIVLTEPLTSAQWERIGWQGNECVASARYTIDYLSRTTDGRILFGGRGAPYHVGSRIEDRFDRHRRTHAMLRQMLVNWFPSLKGIHFTHAWGGPLAVTRDWMPTMSFDPETNIATARGYTGHGVATANLSGRVLTDLLTGVASPLTSLPMVGHRSRRWEPEPLRWLGQRYVQRSLRRLDEKAERTGEAPTGRTLAERLAGH